MSDHDGSEALRFGVNAVDIVVRHVDITTLPVDVIVSSDDNEVSMGGGVSKTIRLRGGAVIQQEAKKQLPAKQGDVIVTGAGNLSAKHVFHALVIDAARLVESPPTAETVRSAVRRCFELAFSRQPTADELAACLAHWQEIERLLPAEAEPLPLSPREIIREAVEENTGERFTFAETLYASRDFVPDLQPTDVDRHVRALADVCLALFNASEFSYVY